MNVITEPMRFPGRIALGTWPMGVDPAQRDREIGAVTHALEAGYRLLDTAEMYADGEAERIIGSALRSFDASRRSELCIVSKVKAENASAEGTVGSCEASIKRMGCDYLDLYLLHWPGAHPFIETLRGFDQLQRRGLIRNFGVSNFSVNDLQQWHKAERRLGIAATVQCNEIMYNVQSRGVEAVLLPWQKAHHIKTLAYSPLGRDGSASLAKHPLLEQLGRERGVTGAQIALAWCVRDPNVVVISKSTDPQRLEQNLHAAALQLSVAELRQIDRAFPLRLKWLRQLTILHRVRSAVRNLKSRRQ